MVEISNQENIRLDTFYALEPQKRRRIIDAALKEFARKGYKHASTNRIAADAQIGKGMLFYYFGSKEELFDFLCEYAIEFIRREFLDKFMGETNDFIERQRLLSIAKQRAMDKEPLMFALFESFYQPLNAGYAAKYTELLMQYQEEFYRKVYEGVDYSLFRPDIVPQNAVQYITWLLEGYTAKIKRKLTDGDLKMDAVAEEEWTEYDAFLDDLKKMFYQ